MSSVLAIFAKAPLVGQVKTRLCPPLSPGEATELYCCFLFDSVARACALPHVDVCLAFTPADSEPLFRELLPFPLCYLPQRGASLGEREANVFTDLLQAGYESVVIVGGDIPTLPLTHLNHAFTLLADPQNDVVIGPSEDGGYYLIGARALHPALFKDIAWSTPTVFTETLVQAQRVGLRIVQIPSWYDVDDANDLRKLTRELNAAKQEPITSHTQAFLARLKALNNQVR